jgi:hypothetical protein
VKIFWEKQGVINRIKHPPLGFSVAEIFKISMNFKATDGTLAAVADALPYTINHYR